MLVVALDVKEQEEIYSGIEMNGLRSRGNADQTEDASSSWQLLRWRMRLRLFSCARLRNAIGFIEVLDWTLAILSQTTTISILTTRVFRHSYGYSLKMTVLSETITRFLCNANELNRTDFLLLKYKRSTGIYYTNFQICQI